MLERDSQQDDEKQLIQIAQFLGRDARHVVSDDKSIAGLVQEEIESLREAVRVRGGCRLLSDGDKCDCGLCKRDNEIRLLRKKVSMNSIIVNQEGESITPWISLAPRGKLWQGQVGTHDYCDGHVYFARISKTHHVLHCDSCNLRISVPSEVDDWHVLQEYLESRAACSA